MDLSPEQFDRIRAYVHRACGLALADDKAYLVRQRLEPLARASGCAGFGELADRLEAPAPLWLRDQVIEAMTTHETSFFRDGHPFDALRTQLLPRRVAARAGRRGAGPVRLWCAGASTGQEAYSAAICVLEYLDASRPAGLAEGDFAVLATDVSALALATAEAGLYGEREVQRGLTPARLQRHFEHRPGGWAVGERVRRLVQFRRLNLVEPFPELGRFDVVLCRNVLIYFDLPIRQRVCDQFGTRLADGGFLCLGAAESLFGLGHRLTAVRHGDTQVYGKPAADS